MSGRDCVPPFWSQTKNKPSKAPNTSLSRAKLRNKKNYKSVRIVKNSNPQSFLFILLSMMLPSVALAQGVDVSANMKTLSALVLDLTPLIGFVVFGGGIYQFYKYSKTRDERYGVASSIFKIVAGALLVSINWLYGFLVNSFVTGSNSSISGSRMLLAVDTQMAQGASVTLATGIIPASTISGLLGFVAFIGIVAFINGLMALKNLGDGRHDERDLYKAITRIVGGLVCLNIKWFSCFFGTVFGVTMFCS